MTRELYVVTGGPSSGKTTIINELAKRGYKVLPESAAEVIQEMQQEGKDPSKDFAELQKRIFLRQHAREEELEGLAVLDRSYVDVLAYYKVRNLKIPDPYWEKAIAGSYAKVFLLELLPFVDDGIRYEKSQEVVEKIHKQLKATYEELGHEIVEIPALSVEERLKLILEHLPPAT